MVYRKRFDKTVLSGLTLYGDTSTSERYLIDAGKPSQAVKTLKQPILSSHGASGPKTPICIGILVSRLERTLIPAAIPDNRPEPRIGTSYRHRSILWLQRNSGQSDTAAR